ncbi:RNA polymerase-associated protein rtf1 [Malassezia vespertilionis]|uniref:Plus3 domain-containing protein n=1 Tax=Malassezia vespertilionis TaxID=2020962 RepID=A0A2N1J931_9BASI|nr:RNA polymerase-associated protein rtf1 [Malassezia vespertilionis]PKI83060.1 hypothetical protein MVES_003004 [Malassezia vespertilionis]WFD07794.1 RNA polymerase-associated protein rtf1 [Malassezia vespertilionis]
MSEDGLDEELIALVDEGASSPPSRGALHQASRSGRPAPQLDDSSDDEGDAVETYPLEGIYKHEEDREWLLGMNELDREEVLAQRRDAISKRHQQAQLAAMVRSQQAAAGKSRQSKSSDVDRAKRHKRSHEDARKELEDLDDPFAESEDDVFRESDSEEEAPVSTKAAKLSELRKKRTERQRRRAPSDDDEPRRKTRRSRARSDSDSAYGSDSDYEARTFVRHSRTSEHPVLLAASDEPPSLELLNAIKLGRDQLERLVFMPNARDRIRGCFVRCSWGMREKPQGGKEPIYRVHQITDVQEREKCYDVSNDGSGRYFNTYLTFRWNGKDHTVDLRPISTQPISDSERARWVAAQNGNRVKFPEVWAVQDKQRQLEETLSASLTEEDVKAMVLKKRALRSAAEASGAQRPRSAPSPVSNVRYDEHAMAQINERNRREDRERIQGAERRAQQLKRAASKAKETVPRPDAAAAVSSALADAPSGTAVVANIDIDLGDF